MPEEVCTCITVAPSQWLQGMDVKMKHFVLSPVARYLGSGAGAT